MFLSPPSTHATAVLSLSSFEHTPNDQRAFFSVFPPEDNIIQNTFSSSLSVLLLLPSESLILRAIFHLSLAPHLPFRGICHTFKRAKIASSYVSRPPTGPRNLFASRNIKLHGGDLRSRPTRPFHINYHTFFKSSNSFIRNDLLRSLFFSAQSAKRFADSTRAEKAPQGK
jgi:hypothetical protein